MYIGDNVPGKVIKSKVKKHLDKKEDIKGIMAQRKFGKVLNFVIATDKQLVLWTSGPYIGEKPVKESRIRFEEFKEAQLKSGLFSNRIVLMNESKKVILKNLSETDATGLASIINTSLDEERKKLEANTSKNTAKERLLNITAARKKESERVKIVS